MAPLVTRILLATDFSECSELAFQHSLVWANACEAELQIFHVVELHPHLDIETDFTQVYLREQEKAAKKQLDNLFQRAKLLTKQVQAHSLIGIPADRINQHAEDIGADIVFLGTHGLTGLNRILLGSTAERVVNGAPCPVITIRQTQQTEEQPEPQGEGTLGSEQKSPSVPSHLLVPMDFSDCSLEAVEYGLQVAKEFEVSATLLHVMEPMTYSLDFNLTHRETQKHQREEAQKRMTEVAEVFQARGVTTTILFKDAPVADAILQGIKEVEPDLIVMGTHGRRGFSRLLLGSVASALLRQASIPLLTVKSPKYAPTHPRREKDAASKTFSTSG